MNPPTQAPKSNTRASTKQLKPRHKLPGSGGSSSTWPARVDWRDEDEAGDRCVVERELSRSRRDVGDVVEVGDGVGE